MGRPPKFTDGMGRPVYPGRLSLIMHPRLIAWARVQAKRAGLTIGDWISEILTEKKGKA